MKTLNTTLALLIITFLSYAQNTISISDLEILDNTKWKGELRYLDYQSGELSSAIETNLQIKIENNIVKYNMQYVYEPHKNNKSSVKIRKSGTYFGNEKIVSNTINDGTRTVITSYKGKDNSEKAIMYVTRKFNNTSYSISKKVVYKNSGESIIRNTYIFTKIN